MKWFVSNARDLPWRGWPLDAPRDPYRVLISECMLQQTQVSRVLGRFEAFLAAFPTIQALAQADEGQVLALWSGLGYYRRARSLHACAKEIVRAHDGRIPHDIALLRRLPGIGEYTAGAVASLAFGAATPAVDANVHRVHRRLGGRADPDSPQLMAWSTARSASLMGSRPRRAGFKPSLINEALIELGALVCTPKAPRCSVCPVASHCIAFQHGDPSSIPPPKSRGVKARLYCITLLARDASGRVLVEQRARDGLWGALWQGPTLEDASPIPIRRAASRWGSVRVLGKLEHQTTHRVVEFHIVQSKGAARAPEGARWVAPSELATLGLSSPQRRILMGELNRSDRRVGRSGTDGPRRGRVLSC